MSPAPGNEVLSAVLDTNIYIAAFAHPKGRNAAVWNAAVDGRYRLVGSPADYPRDGQGSAARFRMAGRPRADGDPRGAPTARIIVPHSVISAVAADPDDNRILECADRGGSGLPPNA